MMMSAACQSVSENEAVCQLRRSEQSEHLYKGILCRDSGISSLISQLSTASHFHYQTTIPTMSQQNKVALITGGASGLGKNLAEALHSQGATLIIADFNVAGGEAFVAELNSARAGYVFTSSLIAFRLSQLTHSVLQLCILPKSRRYKMGRTSRTLHCRQSTRAPHRLRLRQRRCLVRRPAPPPGQSACRIRTADTDGVGYQLVRDGVFDELGCTAASCTGGRGWLQREDRRDRLACVRIQPCRTRVFQVD